MVTAAVAYFSASLANDVDIWLKRHLGEQEREQLDHLGDVLVSLLAPLAQVRSKRELATLLPKIEPSYIDLLKKLFNLLLGDNGDLQQIKEPVGHAYNHMRDLINTKFGLLGEETSEQLLGALDSTIGLYEWSLEKGNRPSYRLDLMAAQLGSSPLYAAMCLTTTLAILQDTITNWAPESIPVLCAAADEYMTLVEDVFLEASSDIHPEDDAVEFDSVRKGLSL